MLLPVVPHIASSCYWDMMADWLFVANVIVHKICTVRGGTFQLNPRFMPWYNWKHQWTAVIPHFVCSVLDLPGNVFCATCMLATFPVPHLPVSSASWFIGVPTTFVSHLRAGCILHLAGRHHLLTCVFSEKSQRWMNVTLPCTNLTRSCRLESWKININMLVIITRQLYPWFTITIR